MYSKILRRGVLVAIVAAAVFCSGCMSEPPTPEPPKSTDVSKAAFPIRPSDAAWAKFQTHDEMVEATQLPDQMLRLPTDRLLDICLDYPLLGDMLAYNNPSRGLDFVAAQFNGLRELLARPDIGPMALAKYKTMRPEDILSTSSSPDTPAGVMNLAMFEVILARPEVAHTMTTDQQLELAALSSHNLRVKLDALSGDVFGSLSIDTAALLSGRAVASIEPSAIAAEEKATPGLSAFLKGDGHLDDTVLAAITDHGAKAMADYKIKKNGGVR